ncbi:MAG: type II toxin-antitoxin system RelE/ParE family toxin [Bacteroidales bacterium]|nr:type II toxin-antitoxin system RelE/ParE family toxin [Bacteroidales bacterium]
MVYAPEVKLDVQDAIDWYNKRQAGLGARFLKELKKYYGFIKKNPEGAAIKYDITRCCPLNKFPYMVHYRFDKENSTIYVDAVFNTSRDPEIWKDR